MIKTIIIITIIIITITIIIIILIGLSDIVTPAQFELLFELANKHKISERMLDNWKYLIGARKYKINNNY